MKFSTKECVSFNLDNNIGFDEIVDEGLIKFFIKKKESITESLLNKARENLEMILEMFLR